MSKPPRKPWLGTIVVTLYLMGVVAYLGGWFVEAHP